MHVKKGTCTHAMNLKNYLRLRVTRGHSVLSLIHRRSKITSLQSHGIVFFMHVLCKRIFLSFCANCSHSRWNHFNTLPLSCKILDCSGHTLMCLFETDACSSGQENNSAKRTLILSAVVQDWTKVPRPLRSKFENARTKRTSHHTDTNVW